MGLRERSMEQRNKLKETELGLEEAEEPRAMSKVYMRSKEEYDRHRRTRLPCRCAQAKRKNSGHLQHGK